MNDVQKISEFVEQIFDRYDLDKCDFFYYLDDYSMNHIPRPLFPTGQIDDETLCRISIRTGLTKDEIINMDRQAAVKYWNKYPFFPLYDQYLSAWSWHQNFVGNQPTAEELLIRAIFSDDGCNFNDKRRYAPQDLRKRLIETIKEIDRVVPGTYHKGAEITHLRISTQIFFSFPKCADMLRSFVDMVNRTEELFFAAIHRDLNDEEINELNFLATWLAAIDIVSGKKICYELIRAYRNIYIEENSQDFFFYVKIRSFIHSNPWRCQEFFDDMDLVKDFLYIFPEAKAKMRKFAHEVTRFSCCFVWSDAKPIRFSDEDEEMMAQMDAMCGWEPLTDSNRAKEPTYIYINKRPDEMQGWDVFAKRLKKAAGPTSKGGIAVPYRKPQRLPEIVDRITQRMEALSSYLSSYGGALYE